MKHLFYVLLFSLCVQGCATNSFVLTEPHLYSHSYLEALKAVDTALKKSNIAVLESKETPDSYWLQVYIVDPNNQYDLGQTDPQLLKEMLHTADIYVEKVNDVTTRIKVIEEEQLGHMPTENKQNIARDFYRKLNRIIDLEDESAH